jgi:hypothetical protein
MDDERLDAFLAGQLADTPIPDRGFAAAVGQRVQKHRRLRRAVLGVVGGVATVLASALTVSADLPAPMGTPSMIVSLMVLTAACGLIWIATEARTTSGSGFSRTPNRT